MNGLKNVWMVLFAMLFGACTPGRGTIRIELTDGPADDLVAAVVTIDEVYLQGGEGTGRVVLRSDPVVVNLLTLSNDVATLVEDHPVPDGSYEQLRFVISGAYIEVANPDGSTTIFATPGYAEAPRIDAALVTPSWSASGFKIQMPDSRLVVQGDQRVLLVDFDVAASFTHMTGNGAWVATPVIRALDLVLTSTLHVDVAVPPSLSPALLDSVSVVLVDAAGLDEGRLMLVDPDGDGTASADYLFLDPREGPFTLSLESASGTSVATTPPTPLSVAVTSGGVTNVSLLATGPGL